ncbi:MAG: DUF1284 domain-containing protein [Sarcina sp.]|nr:DUF1284 domain-containing protein [Sarcina sp.]
MLRDLSDLNVRSENNCGSPNEGASGEEALQEVRLRPHHLLCLQNFRGRGYSPEFVQRMTEISGRTGFLHCFKSGKNDLRDVGSGCGKGRGVTRGQALCHTAVTECLSPCHTPCHTAPSSHPSPSSSAPASIRLVWGCDDLCRSCPNYVDGRCRSDKPERFDELVLDYAGLAAGHVFTEGPASKGMPRMSSELLEACCPDCEWLSLCREICSGRA